MRAHPRAGMSLYASTGARKYLNAAERRRFIEAAQRASPEVRLFCLMLLWSGGRISEVLALTPAAIDFESGVASIGGRTALELQGYARYLARTTKEVHLYGPEPPPRWLYRLSVEVAFVYHNSTRLFPDKPDSGDLSVQPWGQWEWPLTMSSPELALLELLDELPTRETFHQVDKLFEGLTSLSPRRLQKLLLDCKSIKVKRLFFFFAARHEHAWLKRLDRKQIDLGSGKRVLVKGGKLDPATLITVPEDMDAVR